MNQQNAPFKFLDAYQEDDHAVFFGREEETETLYDALNGVKHLLVYGPSGAGKTSLVECGLRNQFSDADWYAITIRRRNNINAAVFEVINEALEEKIVLDSKTGLPQNPNTDFGQAIEQLFEERYQPIYLLFDQFEELLLLAKREEKLDFFMRLNDLIRYRVPCRVLFIMREEFIGHLSEVEHLCPSIFKHRFRLEKMGRPNVRQVIYQILESPEYQNDFQVADSEQLANTILSKLPDQKREIELTHVQVFLSELWDRAIAQTQENTLPLLQKSLIQKKDNLESVLDAFLKKQLQELEITYGEKVPLELLALMISKQSTKLQLTETEFQTALKDAGIQLHQQLPVLLNDLKKRRILRTLKTGDLTRYELSHDLLALVVGQNLTEEIQLREKAKATYEVYAERQGYFSQEDLDYLRAFEGYWGYPDILEKRILESEFFLKEEEEKELVETRRRLQTVRGLLAAAVVGVLVAIGFGVFGFQKARLAEEQTEVAETEADNAKQALATAKAEEARRVIQEVDNIIERAVALKGRGYQEANVWRNMLKEAQSILNEYKDNELLLIKQNEIKKLLK
ncbi:MAG: ATP-binding protein [Bacteroidota bacterium]